MHHVVAAALAVAILTHTQCMHRDPGFADPGAATPRVPNSKPLTSKDHDDTRLDRCTWIYNHDTP
eukprot:2430068-Rhodomonas_salina.1